MDLDSSSSNFYEKRNIAVGFKVMCSSAHKVFLCMHMRAHIYTHTHIPLKHTPHTCITYISKAAATVSMMASVHQKAQCVTWLAKNKSTAKVQHNFCHTHGRDPPVSKAIWL